MKFQGAIMIKVLHGIVNIYGAKLDSKSDWHKVISDPRKNMLLSIVNKTENT